MAEEGGKNNEYEAKLKKELSGLTSPTDEELGKVRNVFKIWKWIRPDSEPWKWKSLISAPPKPSIISSSISLVNLGLTGAEVNATGVFVNGGGFLMKADGGVLLEFLFDTKLSEKISRIVGERAEVTLTIKGVKVTDEHLNELQRRQGGPHTFEVGCRVNQ